MNHQSLLALVKRRRKERGPERRRTEELIRLELRTIGGDRPGSRSKRSVERDQRQTNTGQPT